MSNGCIRYKDLSFSRTFDEEGRPYPIADDDLSEILSKSDFAKPKRSWVKMPSLDVQIPECPAFESCKALGQVKCYRCVDHRPVDSWKRWVRKQIRKAKKAGIFNCQTPEGGQL